MRRWKLLSGFAVFAAASVLAVGCSSSEEEPAASGTSSTSTPAASSGTTVTVSLRDTLKIEPDKTSASAGNITFKAENKGSLEHEMTLLKTDLAPDKLPQKDGIVDTKGAGVTEVATTANLAAGKTESKAAELAAGKYVLICNVAGHYLGGMHTAFTVN